MSRTLFYLWWSVLVVCSSQSHNSNEKNTDKQTCGVSPFNKNSLKIVGGKNSTLGSWPWMAAIYYRKTSSRLTWFGCSGSLIANNWILTAAHCIPNKWENYTLDYIRLGDLDIDEHVNDGAKPIEVKVTNVIKHPNYSKSSKWCDIALLQLDELVPFTDYISPICLHKGENYSTMENIYDLKRPTIAGWGDTAPGKRSTTHLLEVSLDTVPLERCKKLYAKPIQAGEVKLDKLVLCCKAPKKDSCQGDSGGPLMFIGRGSVWSQGGIISYGYECGNGSYPGVYTKVAPFVTWIEKQTGLIF